jgi:hypothetical protein
MKRIGCLLTAVTVALSIAACGSSQTKTVIETATGAGTSVRNITAASSTTASTAMTKAQAAKLYLTDVAQANAALKKLESEVTRSTPEAQGQTDAKPVVTAYQTADEKLLDLAQQYPPAATDIKAMVTDDSAVVADYQDIAAPTNQQADQDIAKDQAAVNIVRSDLGLPQRTN